MADKASVKVTITNNDVGPRYVHSDRGMEVVRVGEALTTVMKESQITATEEAVIDGTDDLPRFNVERAKSDAEPGSETGKPLDSFTVPQLRKLGDAESVDFGDKTGKADLIEAIKAKRLTIGAGSVEGGQLGSGQGEAGGGNPPA